MLVRELVTRFGFDVDNAALNKLDANIGRISLALGAAGAAMAGLPLLLVRSRKETEMALGSLTSVGVKDLDALEKRATEFSNKYAGVTKAAFLDAAYVTKSALSSLSDDAVGEFTALAALSAKATKGELGTMIQTFGAAYESFKSLFKDMTDIEFGKELTAQISKTANIFNSDGKKIANSLKDIGATATNAGISMAEQFAVLGMLQANDPTGSLSGTRYRNFISNAARAEEALNKGITGGKRVSFLDPKTGYLKSALEVVKEIKRRFPDLKKAADSLDLREAFGSPEALAVVQTLIDKLPQLEENIAAVAGASKNGTKEAEEMALAMNRGMGSDLLLQRLGNLAEALGKPLQEPMDKTADKIGEFTVWLQKLTDKFPKTATAIVSFVAGLGVLLFVGSSVVGMLALMSAAFTTLGITAGGAMVAIFAIPLALLALVAAIGLVLNELYRWVNGQASIFEDLLGPWEDFVWKVFALQVKAYEMVKSAWSGLKDFFRNLWDDIYNIVASAVDKIAAVIPMGFVYKKVIGSALGAAASAGAAILEPTYGGGAQPLPGAAMAGTTNNVTAPVTVNMTVPQGTTAEQSGAIQQTAQATFEAFEQAMRNSLADVAGANR